LEELEPLTHRFIQIPITTYNQMKIDKEIPKDIEGYNYTTGKGIAMVEHHTDDAPKFQKDQSELQFGRSLLVCKPINEKPLIISGRMSAFTSNTSSVNLYGAYLMDIFD
jgi:hypothetical protein